MSFVTNSGAIPEDSGGIRSFLRIPVEFRSFLRIPVDSCGISGFRTESVGHCKVLAGSSDFQIS